MAGGEGRGGDSNGWAGKDWSPTLAPARPFALFRRGEMREAKVGEGTVTAREGRLGPNVGAGFASLWRRGDQREAKVGEGTATAGEGRTEPNVSASATICVASEGGRLAGDEDRGGDGDGLGERGWVQCRCRRNSSRYSGGGRLAGGKGR